MRRYLLALLALAAICSGCSSRPAPPQPFVSSILPTLTPQPTRPTITDTSPLPSPVGQTPFTYNSVTDLLARRPPPGQTVQVDAYYSRYIVRSSSGPAPLPGQIVCTRWPAWLSDAPATGCEAVGDDQSCSKPPPGAAYVFLLQASQIGPGRVPIPLPLPYHARFVGHLDDPILAQCPDADKIFVLEKIAQVYQEKP